jgi:4-amino-4-deoxy-L-arabinose transferase-like glycosyltransferase
VKYSLKSILQHRYFFLWACIAIILLRIVLNTFVPLMDKTEARYAEIARIMVETNNWVTPQIDYGVPFWAKPVLSTWLSALSMKVLGVNEFAVRLPSLLLSLLMVFMVNRFAGKKELPLYFAGFVIITLPEFLLHMGVVSTDITLALSVALIMLSFWKSVSENQKSVWNYLFFAGIGLGMLAKGPIALMLTFPPLFIWMVLFKEYKKVLRAFPWLTGTLLLILIAAPWYWMAEIKSPGFLNYFIIGEHFKRFFDSGWKGDLYGFPKQMPLGIIWLFLVAGTLPWIITVIYRAWLNRPEVLKNKWPGFLLLWLLWTPLFFTVSKSLIHTYVLPVMIPVALLVTYWWTDIKNKTALVFTSLVLPFLFLIAFIAGMAGNRIEHFGNTDKYLILNQSDTEITDLYYLNKKSYSSQFYSRGKVKTLSQAELTEKLNGQVPFRIIIQNKHLKKLGEKETGKLRLIESNYNRGLYEFHD